MMALTFACGSPQIADQVKRYQYLLGQTDIFAHFLKLKNIDQYKADNAIGGKKGKAA